MRRDLLERLLPVWRCAFREGLFVEIPVPSALLALAARPIWIDDYLWEFGEERDRWRRLARDLFADPAVVFAHPVKLSGLSEAEVAALCRGTIA